jgi:transcriptional regulator with XRE-family HTH domain
MKIGNKIRKIRELKNISPKDMADRLNITPQGLNKIEREEVDVNIERLLEIAGVFEMKPEDLLTFDEKNVFNNYGEIKGAQHMGTYYAFPEEMKKLYEENAKLQADKIAIQEKMIQMLEEKMKGLEKK